MRQSWAKIVRAVFVLICIILTSACQADFHETLLQQQEVGFYAGGMQTRTQMQPNGLSTAWDDGDELAVWARNSSGALVLNRQIFYTYGIDSLGYFTTKLDAAMPEDNYTYMCTYPAPVSMNGMKATFNLSATQNGSASDGSDIMIATPVQHGRLIPIPQQNDDHSGMSMVMNHMMHHLRFWIPSGTNVMNEKIQKIEVTMPNNIVGNVIADISDPNAQLMLGSGSKKVTLVLENPLGESDFNNAEFAYAVIYPSEYTYTDSDYMNITLFTNSGKSVLDPIPLSGRKFLSGHSTPVRIVPKPAEVYCNLVIKTGRNNIGEVLWNIKISSGGKELYKYSNTDGTYHNIVHEEEYIGSAGKATYDAIVNAVADGTAVLNFETNNASVDIPMTSDMMVRDGNSAVLNLGDVPYLLYEDFSTATTYAKNDAYAATMDSDTGSGGYLLNGYLSLDGWNGSRFGLIEGDCVRINCRYEGAVFAYRKYCGRLDTPAFKYLKSGAKVDVVLEYDKAMFIPAGYKLDTSGAKAKYYVGYHTKSEGSTIGGIQIGSLSDVESNITGNSTIVYNSGLYASENVGEMTNQKVTIPSATNSTRAVFYVNTTETKIVFEGMNSCYYLYLDNIKVYIKN